MANTRVEVVTPERNLFSGEAEMVVCRTVGGEIAFLADHMPYIGVLEPCVVRLEGAVSADGSGPAELLIAAQGGFVEVKDNQVIMLIDVAELAADVDPDRARRALAAAGSGDTPETEAALKRAQIRLEVAGVTSS